MARAYGRWVLGGALGLGLTVLALRLYAMQVSLPGMIRRGGWAGGSPPKPHRHRMPSPRVVKNSVWGAWDFPVRALEGEEAGRGWGSVRWVRAGGAGASATEAEGVVEETSPMWSLIL